MRTLPTGIVTFLFTDIEGSTRLLQHVGDTYHQMLEEHHRLLRAAIDQAGGTEVSTAGDSFFAVFPTASQAVEAAIAAQRSLSEHRWPEEGSIRVRMGLHAGTAAIHDGDYAGLDVHRAARISDAGHGSQILISSSVHSLVNQQLPQGASLLDLGQHLLKDLREPEHLYQLVIAGLLSDFPPLRSLNTRPHNLPSELTDFVGREEELAELTRLFADPHIRLVTILGPGGMGKTRLAQELAVTLLSEYRQGVYFVELAPLSEAGSIPVAVADALHISLQPGDRSPQQQLLEYFSERQMLLVLDNFEHLLDEVDFVNSMLQAAPMVNVLATSRQRLHLSGETVFTLDGMHFPDWETLEGALAYSAVRLFVQSAQRVRPNFDLTAANMGYVARICRLVYGMPLGILLAAAWVEVLSPQEIADEIERSLDFLASELRDMPERQRSIRAVFAASWQRLSSAEQAVFKRLAVFRGGLTRDAAQAVAQASLPILSALVGGSLLRRDSEGRYQIHELLRQYAAEQLEKSAGDVQQTQADHAHYYIQFLYQRRQDVSGGRQGEALLEIKEELDNIRVAWLWAVAHVDADALQQASQSLGLYFQFLGGYLEGMTLFSQATEVLQAQPQSEATDLALLGTLMYQGWYHLRFGHQEGTEACMLQSQAIYRRLQIPPLPGYLSDPNAPLSFVALTRGDYATALQYAELIRQVAETQQHSVNRQFAYHLLSEANLGLGEYETAQQFAQQAYAQAQTNGDRWFMAYILNNMGQIAVALGDNRMGITHFQSSYEIRQAFDDPEGMALALINLGNLALKERSFVEAEEQYQRSRTIYQDINDKGGLAAANWGLGIVSSEQGDCALAQGYFRQALQLAVEIDYRPVLFGLLVDIAELLWKMGQRERPLTLLAFTVLDSATDHETQNRAQTRLADDYQKMVSPQLFAAATAKGEASDLDMLASDLLYQLSLPPTTASEEYAAPLPTEPIQDPIEPLTPRELDVLKLLCQGLTNREIANELSLAISTVKFCTSQVYGKLGVRNRAMAVARAHELHLIDSP